MDKAFYMGACGNSGPFLGPQNTRSRIILRTRKGTIVLTTTHTGIDRDCCGFGPYSSPYTGSTSFGLTSNVDLSSYMGAAIRY